MSDERKQSFGLIAFEGRGTADSVYDTLRNLEHAGQVDIKTAASIYREDDGKIKVHHHRRVTVGKGAFGGAAIGLLLAGTGVGLLAGAVMGAMVGSSRSGQRRELKKFLDDKLGPNDSALAILINDADWAAVKNQLDYYKGEPLMVELTPDAEEKLAALAQDDEVAEALQGEIEIEETDEAEAS